VLRAGFGIFYDRFGLGNTLTARRFDGLVQQQFVAANPDFFPNVPSPALLAGFESAQVTQKISSRMQAPYILQSAVTFERQLPANTTIAVTYTNSHGLHLFRSEDINAPLPGTYNPGVPNSGLLLGRPDRRADAVLRHLQPESGDRHLNAKVNAGLCYLVYVQPRDEQTRIVSAPSRRIHMTSRANTGRHRRTHHRFTIGSINLKWAVRISPFVGKWRAIRHHKRSDIFGTTVQRKRMRTIPPGPARSTAYGC
jgi:hypothetical protein